MREPDSPSVKAGTERQDVLRAADFLRAQGQAALADWEREARLLYGEHALRGPWLIDHMPQLILLLADACEHGDAELLDSSLPDEHAVTRLDQGFDLGEVASEFALLRKCLLLRLEQVGAVLAPGELVRLEGTLDQAVSRTMTRYSQASHYILQALDRMTRASLGSPDMDTLLERLLTVLMESALSADAAAVLLLEGDTLTVRAAVGLGTEETRGTRVRLGEGFVGQVGSTRQPQAVRSAVTDERVRLAPLKNHGLRALYGVPLLEGERLVGVAYMGSRTAFDFSDSDTLLFRTMVQRATAHVVQAQLQGLERDARVDAERSLALLDALLGATPMGIAFLDTGLRYVRINQALADINDVPADAHLGKRFRDVLPPPVADMLEPVLLRALATGEPVQSMEYSTPPTLRRLVNRTWQSSFYPVRMASGEIVGLGCTLVDITQHKLAERTLQQGVAFREQLLAVLGHDLRNPLNAINASAWQLARAEEDLEEPERRAVARIRKATARMGRMINDILDFARSRLGGGIPVTRQRVNLADVCQATLEELQVSWPEHRLLFEAEGDTWAEADPDRVAQVLGNLVANALQHGREDTPVHTRVRGEADDVVLEVCNQGEPIPPEFLPRVFDPFKTPIPYPDEAERKRRSLGLGLYIVSQIAKVHGGRVEVRSTSDEGTLFTVYWPRAPPASEPS